MPTLSRRNFFSSMVAASVVVTLDPDELLWTPGKKKFFLPSLTSGEDEYRSIWFPSDFSPSPDELSAMIAKLRSLPELSAMIAKLRFLPGPVRSISSWGAWKA